MLFMVVEHYRNADAKAVYERFRARGRMLPDGLRYVNSWVQDDFARCFQLMETDDQALFEKWTQNWSDLVDFEIVRVLSSAEASAANS
jgi:Protein of unknown function (DUF3303)